jgi:ABC-type Fe3+ transport system substrate-binding protein
VGKARGDAIDMVVPDDTLLIPNTAALVRNAPHPAEARRFLDFLLRAETEALLAKGRSRQIPVRGDVPRGLRVDWAKLSTSEGFLERARKALDL